MQTICNSQGVPKRRKAVVAREELLREGMAFKMREVIACYDANGNDSVKQGKLMVQVRKSQWSSTTRSFSNRQG